MMPSPATAESNNNIPTPWIFLFISIKFSQVLYALITIASIIAVFTTNEIKFFYPLIPLYFFLGSSRNLKLLKKSILDTMMIAAHDSLAKDFTKEQMAHVFADKKDMRYIEMYSKPVFAREKILFVIETILLLAAIASVILFTVFPFLNWWQFLLVQVICILLSYPIKLQSSNWALKRAMLRWVLKYKMHLNANVDLKNRILTFNKLKEEDLDRWLENQIRVIYRNKINPDLVSIDHLAVTYAQPRTH